MDRQLVLFQLYGCIANLIWMQQEEEAIVGGGGGGGEGLCVSNFNVRVAGAANSNG